MQGPFLKTYRLLLRCSGSIQCSIRSVAIRDFKNFAKISSREATQPLARAETPEDFGLAAHSSRYATRRETGTFRSPTKSIAVLPFENLSRDPDNADFADGVQDEILTDLSRIADLKVIGRASAMQYKSGVARDLRKISHELGVANVVEGSVQRSGNRLRVNAQLVDARTHRQLWGQTYDRDLADVFAIQSEIARRIAESLQARL